MIGSPALRVRAVSATVALVAGAGLLAYEPASLPANAAGESEPTESAVTLTWSDGLTGADNEAVLEPRDATDPRYGDFDGLQVTVAQTEGVRAQAVDITWTGWKPASPQASDYGYSLQIMQCWAADDSGPTPETCVWAPSPLAGDPARFRSVDPRDPLAAAAPDVSYPFRPVYGGDPTTGSAMPFDQWTTTEVPGAKSDANGGGEVIFALQDGIDAPHLGCGLTTADDEPRDCWLVIVPFGGQDYDGTALDPSARLNVGHTFSPSNWANRMQVHLDFEAVDDFCPAGSERRLTAGGPMVAEAVYSWQPVLCQDGGAIYDYAPTSDSEGRRQLIDLAPGSAGLAFTSGPAVAGEDGPGIMHAPVAVSGAAIAFNLEQEDRSIVRDLRLTPRLVAKLLTQSYLDDLPGGLSSGIGDQAAPWWGSETGIDTPPANLLADPEFQALNDHVTARPFHGGRNGGVKIRVSGGSADAIRELWRWIQADSDAVAWLGGEPDEQGMVVNPFFGDLDLGEPPALDRFLREVDRCYREGDYVPEPGVCSLDWMPYTNDFEDSALQTRLGASGARGPWDVNGTAPDGSQGWFGRVTPQQVGARAMLAITDTASAARYGLPTAALRNAAGEFVVPTEVGLLAGLETMVPGEEVEDVLALDPEAEAADAYPLTMVTYAAVRDSEEPEVLADYADLLRYAAEPGQEPGLAAGQLPEGFVPLPEDLREQTLAVADALTAEDPPTGPPSFAPAGGDDDGDEDPGDDAGAADGTDAGDGGDAAGGPGATGAADGVPGGAEAPDPNQLTPGGDDPGDDGATTPPPDGAADGTPDDSAPPPVDDADPVAQATPGEPVGPMQYALLVVLIVGLAGALGGPALLQLGPRRS